MVNAEAIKTAFERNQKALKIRPGIGKGTAATRVSVRSGMTCDIREGDWQLVADMSEKHGGDNAGPNPGIFGRAALGSCIAIGYMRWAAVLDVPIDELEVVVEADYDALGEFAVEDQPADYTEIRYVVSIKSSANEEDIFRVLDTSDGHSSFLDIFRRPQNVRRIVEINSKDQE